MPKDYWIGSGQFLEGIGKPLGNAQIPLSARMRRGRIAQRLLAKHGNFHPFSLKQSVSVHIY
jgi:hypothetical protein